MKLTHLPLADTFIIEPKVFNDERGYFFESFNAKTFKQLSGQNVNFVQDNQSSSKKGVIRGLHYQLPPHAQAKLVRVLKGEIWDVIVDLRKEAKTTGRWYGVHLSEENKKQLWIPEGFAHGFLTLSDTAEVSYKVTQYYEPTSEKCLAWDDATINIHWPEHQATRLSQKDQKGTLFKDCHLF